MAGSGEGFQPRSLVGRVRPRSRQIVSGLAGNSGLPALCNAEALVGVLRSAHTPAACQGHCSTASSIGGGKAEELAAKEAKEKAAEVSVVDEVPGVPNHDDGDITDVLCKGHDAAAKKKLVQKLNHDENINREKAVAEEFTQAAAEVLRHRLTVADSIAAAKTLWSRPPERKSQV